MTLIGRQNEKTLLLEIEKSNEPELVAVYGRRRVGKTFLIQNTFGEELVFEFTGTHHAALKNQLESFTLALTRASKSRSEERRVGKECVSTFRSRGSR